MNYKLLFELELEKNKHLEDQIIVKDIQIKKLENTIKVQENHIEVLEAIEKALPDLVNKRARQLSVEETKIIGEKLADLDIL